MSDKVPSADFFPRKTPPGGTQSGHGLRLLVVSDLYPPHFVGGYELRCSWLCEEMARRGHRVRVLCSHYGRNAPARGEIQNGVEVHRDLTDWFSLSAGDRCSLFSNLSYIRRDMMAMSRHMREFAPDVVCWWNAGLVSKQLLIAPELYGVPAVCWVEDIWMMRMGTARRRKPRAVAGFPKNRRSLSGRIGAALLRAGFSAGIPLSPVKPTMHTACYVSAFQQRAHANGPVSFKCEAVIHGAPLPGVFHPLDKPDWATCVDMPIPLLYCGAVTECRRLHILIEAMVGMQPAQRKAFTLTVAGDAPTKADRDYLARVENLVREAGLNSLVRFKGPIPHDRIGQLFRDHAVYILCSTRAEGFPIAMAEAMMSGCLAVTTGAGGAQEMAELCGARIFTPDHSSELKDVLLSLAADREAFASARRHCLETATAAFDFEKMTDAYEKVIRSAFLFPN